MSQRGENIAIDTQLVWMTCGVDAGYQILLAPPEIGRGWVDLIEGAFPNFEVGGPGLRAVEINYEGGKALALAFFDPEQCDASSRPIKHFMLLLGVSDTVFKKAQQLALNGILQQLAPAFDVICRASRYSSEQEICKSAQEKQTHRSLRLEFSGKNAQVKNAPVKKAATKPTVGVVLDAAPNDDQEALRMPVWLMWLFVLVIVGAVIAGVWLE